MEIQDIKARLNIQTVLKYYGLQPDRNGMLKCPFHADDTASMKIYDKTNTFHCFGCGVNGDVIEFIQLKENLSKHEAIVRTQSMLSPQGEIPANAGKAIMKAESFISPLTKEKEPVVKSKPEKQEPTEEPLTPEQKNEILTKIFEGFKNGLHHAVTIKPKEYLQSRKLDYNLLEIGYNSGQFHQRGRLSEADLKACIKAGLLVPYRGNLPYGDGTNYTPFARECIIFPLRNKQGEITSLYGRSILENLNGTSKHFYLKDRTGLYPAYPNPNTTKLILTEAIIDAATLLQYPEILQKACQTELVEVLACYGTNGLTDEHKAAIKELQRLEEIILFFDGDKAGTEGIKHNASILQELGIKLSYVETPENEDVNSLLQGHDPEIFTHLLENRKACHTQNPEPTHPASSLPRRQAGIQNPVSNLKHPASRLNTKNPEFITFTSDNLQIIILGGINLQQLDRLRVTLKISRTDGDPLHSIRHTLDLYHSDYLEKFINKASEQLETGTNVLRRAIAELTEQIEQYRLTKIESMKEQKPQARQLTEERKNKAIRYLKSPNLLQRTNDDIGKTGVIGEEINRLLMYLVFTSRLREQPLHIVSLGASGTGKTYLQEKISELIPEQDKLEITILSENAFYYFDRKELKHKLVLIEDMDGLSAGASGGGGGTGVMYAARELMTKRKISKTLPIKDSKGNLRTVTLNVEGPICLAGTTTRERLYEDNANRSLLIYIDNSPEHKELIMEYQRKLSAGKIDSKKENELKEFFKDMQSVLKPVKVRNPYAEYLKLPEYVFKPLRTNAHYLAFIESITFYCQYQRELKTDPATGETYIETTLEDIEWANKLLKDVLLAKSDELPNAERNFFESLKNWLKTNQRTSFYAKEIRDIFRMHPSKIKRYLYDLTTYNMIKITGGNRFKTGFEYEVTNQDDYNKLESSVATVLDNVLNEIKEKISGSRGLSVVHNENRPLNNQENNKLKLVVQ